MARLARLYVPGLPQLVVQSGNNRQTIFHDAADYRAFMGWLRDAVREQGVALHAYALLPEHFHLLATPADERAIGRALQSVGRRYVAYFNQRYARSGTLWEGRYRSTVLDPDRYLIAAMRYVELGPVQAGLCTDPARYPWSSCAHHVGISQDLIVTDHSVYWALANMPFDRQALYRQALEEGLAADEEERLRAATQKGWMLGDAEFVERHAGAASRRPSIATRGRPRKPVLMA